MFRVSISNLILLRNSINHTKSSIPLSFIRLKPKENSIVFCLRNLSCNRSQQQQQHKSTIDLKKSDSNKNNYNNHDVCKFTIKGNQNSLDEIAKCNVDICVNERNLTLTFNLMWLRHSCRCNQCTHEHSRQRLYDVTKLQLSSFKISNIQLTTINKNQMSFVSPKTIIDEQNIIEIKWNDGHVSKFDLEWLQHISKITNQSKEISENNQQVENKAKRLTLPRDDFYSTSIVMPMHKWNVNDINQLLKPVDYDSLLMPGDNSDGVRNLSEQLVKLGIAKIINVPQKKGEILNVVRRLAYERPTGYGLTFDVVVEPSVKINLAYSSREFDLHVDLAYREFTPGVQLLHCIVNSQEGGENYFCDAFNVASLLKKSNPKAFDILCQIPVTFSSIDPYRNVKFRRDWPIISCHNDDQLEMVHYSAWMLPPIVSLTEIGLFYDAYREFTKIMQDKSNKFITKMIPGDLFIFHNRRVLHGRNKYDPKPGSRFLQGCYMDWDEIVCLYERLHSQ